MPRPALSFSQPWPRPRIRPTPVLLVKKKKKRKKIRVIRSRKYRMDFPRRFVTDCARCSRSRVFFPLGRLDFHGSLRRIAGFSAAAPRTLRKTRNVKRSSVFNPACVLHTMSFATLLLSAFVSGPGTTWPFAPGRTWTWSVRTALVEEGSAGIWPGVSSP